MSLNETHNYRFGLLNGVLFGIANSLMNPTLVMVAFVSTITSSPILIGLIVPLRHGGWFLPQLYASTFLQSRPSKKSFYRTMSLVRTLAWASIAGCLAWVRNPNLLLALFIVLLAINSLAAGFAGLSFMSIVAKIIPQERRTEFFATRLAVGGVLGMGGGLIVHAVLAADSPLIFPQNYLLLFGLGAVFSILACIAFLRTTEPPEDEVPKGTTLRSQLREARKVLVTDITYQVFLKLRMALMVAAMATPFYLVWARDQFGLSAEWVGICLTSLVAASTISYAVNGYYSRQGISNQALITVATIASLLMSALVLVLAVAGMIWTIPPIVAGVCLIFVFILSAIQESGISVTASSMTLDIAPTTRRPLYIGLTNSVIGVVLLITISSGVVVAVSGHVVLFVVAMLANLVALRYVSLRQQARRKRRSGRQRTHTRETISNQWRLLILGWRPTFKAKMTAITGSRPSLDENSFTDAHGRQL